MPSSSQHFTGERPGWGKDFDYDAARHLAAYRYAALLAVGKRVLDAGCGEGFGTQGLADVAAAVVGVDYSREALTVCRRRWNKPNLSFSQVDLTKRTYDGDRFDLVVNFQVLEHMRDEIPFLQHLKALMNPGGQLLLTTPNRLRSFSENPYHVREYTAAELRALLQRVFSRVTLLGLHGNEVVTAFDRRREQAVKRILQLDPFGVRRLLPAPFIHFAFAKLARVVRRQAVTGQRPIVPDDFYVSDENVDDALDLIARCAV